MTIKLAFLSNDRAKFKAFFNVNLWYIEMKIHQHNAGHMSKMSVMLIYGKPLKIFFPGTYPNETLYEHYIP